MNPSTIFWPMIAQVALVYGVYLLMFVRRRKAVTAGSARVSDFRENRNEPPESLFVRNNLVNQFELPILFHICCLALAISGGVGALSLILAWLFVLSRYVHAYIHVTSNRIRWRQRAFSAGFGLVALMWALLAYHITFG